jgi:acetyltransferase EpsM
LIDLLRTLGTYPIAGVVDDRLTPGDHILGAPVLGGSALLPELRQRGLELAVNAVGGIGNISVRIRVFQQLAEAGFTCPALVHPRAFVEPSAQMAAGVQIFPHAYVGSAVQIGFGVIVNTGAIVSHDCQVGDYANLSPGAILAGEVHIGSASLVGMGVTINLQVKVGDMARIGNGATVKQDVPRNSIVHAGTIWPPDPRD